MLNDDVAWSAHIIDDDAPIRDLLGAMLVKNGFGQIVHSNSFAQADGEHADSVCDVYFVDIELGDGSGFDLVRNIKDRYPLAKVVVFSGHGTPHNVKRATDKKINGFLVKPFSQNSLERVLSSCGLVPAMA